MNCFVWIQILLVSFGNFVVSAQNSRCEPITLPICSQLQYNQTIYPNMLHHATQNEAGIQINRFYPLVKVGCSAYLKIFLCSVYVPMCSPINRPFPPCRDMCYQAKLGCERLTNEFGVKWPEELDCELFPAQNPEKLCFGPDSFDENLELTGCKEDVGLTCPSYMSIPQNSDLDYKFMGVKDCSAPCDDDKLLFWNKEKRHFASMWIGVWSFICLVSTLFTVLTYLIDMPRFSYPERPIIFLSGCYLMVSIAYIAGFFLRDNVACKQFHNNYCSFAGGINNCPKVVAQGTVEAGCTILFMIVYFFSMASSIWWVVLTVTWFLAAGLKWGNEAIEQKSPYFHGIAWSIPAAQTVAVLISSKIEGDIYSGVCYVGLYDTDHLLWALLVPLSVFLLFGTGFLIAGFVSMFNIRNIMKHEVGVHRVEKLEKLMVKIGIFSVLYTVPATVTIACYIYELINRESWNKGWLANNCQADRIPCPCEYSEYKNSKPDFIVFILKYFMTLIVGITAGFWIWSSKTVESWTYFRGKLCCNRSRSYRRGTVQRTEQALPTLQVKDSMQRPLYH